MNKSMNYFKKEKEIERREKPRFKVKANCCFQPLDQAVYFDESDIYKIENIGTGGLALLCNKTFDTNSRHFITIAIQSSSTKEPINALGKIMWISRCQYTPHHYRIGVKFVKMLEDDLISLTRHFEPGFSTSMEQELQIN
ncbi:PilZ domain-containing protein [bacterium]|nr:PilZ domain-containing protein [bacterium]